MGGGQPAQKKEFSLYLFLRCWIHHEIPGAKERRRKRGASCAITHSFFFFPLLGLVFSAVLFLQRAHYIAFSIRRDRRPVSRCTDTIRGVGDLEWLLNIYTLLLFLGDLWHFLASGKWADVYYI
jgi:hypothetical protein